MKSNIIKTFVLGAAIVSVGCVAVAMQDELKAGQKAPAFSAKGTDGKTHTLASLTAEGPVVFYFIKEGCPVNHRAAPFVGRIAEAYGKKTRLVGVYNGNEAGAKRWVERYKANYTLLADADMRIIRSFKAPHSPYFVTVAKGGNVEKVVDGSSPEDMAKLNDFLGKAAGMSVAKLDFAGSPSGAG